jgi:hypothetical protein
MHLLRIRDQRRVSKVGNSQVCEIAIIEFSLCPSSSCNAFSTSDLLTLDAT